MPVQAKSIRARKSVFYIALACPRLTATALMALALCLLLTAPVALAIKPGSVAPVGDKWAVVIGISNFADTKVPSLKYAAKDAKDFYEYLIDPSGGRFRADHVKLLTDDTATKINIMDVLGDSFLPHAAAPEDLVVIYLSTHGSPAGADIRGVNYIVAHDTELVKLFATGIEMQQLLRLIKERVHTRRLLLVLDTCYSGAGGSAGHKGLTRTNVDSQEIAQGTGSLVIASSAPDQRSWESESLANSYFTRYFIDALKEDGGKVSIDRAFNTMRNRVQSSVLREKGEMQTPVMAGAFIGPSLVIGVPPSVQRLAPASAALAGGPTFAGQKVLPGGSLASYSQHMRLAKKLVDENRLWDAVHELEQAVTLNPQSVEANIILAEAYDLQSRFREAQAAAKAAVINDENSSRAREKLGLAYLRTGSPDNALLQAQKAVSLDPTNSMAHNLMGYILEHHSSNIDQAQKEYRKALELNALNVRALVNLGLLIAAQRRDFDQAEKLFRQAVAADADDWEARLALGRLLRDARGRHRESERELRQAIEIDPGRAVLHSELALALALDKSRYQEAETEFRKGIQLAPTDARAHYLLAEFLMERLSRIDEAEREFRRAVEINPNLDAARVGLGTLLVIHRKRFDEGHDQFRQALSINPRNADAHVGLAMVYRDLYKNYHGAEEELRKALRLNPQSWRAHDRLGSVLSVDLKRFDEGKAELERAIEADRQAAEPHFNLGNLLAEHYNNFEAAKAEIEKAIELDPSQSRYHGKLGWLLTEHYNQHQLAKEMLSRAAALDPGNAEAHYRLGMLLIKKLGQRKAGEAELEKAYNKEPENLEYKRAVQRYAGGLR